MKEVEQKKNSDSDVIPGSSNFPERAFPEVFQVAKDNDKGKNKEEETSPRKPQAINLEKWPRKRDSRNQSRKRGLITSPVWASENFNQNSPVNESISSKLARTPSEHDNKQSESHQESSNTVNAHPEAEINPSNTLPSHIRPEDIFTVQESDLVPQRDEDSAVLSNRFTNEHKKFTNGSLTEENLTEPIKVSKQPINNLNKEKPANSSANKGISTNVSPLKDKKSDGVNPRRPVDSSTSHNRQDQTDAIKASQNVNKPTFGFARSDSRQMLIPESKNTVHTANKVTISTSASRRTNQDVQSGKRGVVISTGRRKLNGPTQAPVVSSPTRSDLAPDNQDDPSLNESKDNEIPAELEHHNSLNINDQVNKKSSAPKIMDNDQEIKNEEITTTSRPDNEVKSEDSNFHRNSETHTSSTEDEILTDINFKDSSKSLDDNADIIEQNYKEGSPEELSTPPDNNESLNKNVDDNENSSVTSDQQIPTNHLGSSPDNENVESVESKDENLVPCDEETIEETKNSPNNNQLSNILPKFEEQEESISSTAKT